jgi:putative (di)nucleoside polyphosphate hydrolase
VIEFKRDVYRMALNELVRYLPPANPAMVFGSTHR